MSMFSPGTEDQWQQRVAKLLKGEDFYARLVKTVDGLTIAPLYGQGSGTTIGKGEIAPWQIVQRIDHPVPARAIAQALEDLAGGATGLTLVTAEGVADILAALPLHKISLHVEGGTAATQAVARAIANMPLDPARLALRLDANGSGQAMALHAQGFRCPLMSADGRVFHAGSLNAIQELGATLATLASHMRSMDTLDDATIPGAVSATLAATQDMFLTMAKFRAMRLLWARLLQGFGLPHVTLALHGETSTVMMATTDPHANMLRAVAACFGAGLGGASSFTVLPMSIKQGLPNGFSRRVARNAQVMLQEESSLWRMEDPAAGSGYVDQLTDDLCVQAWDVFRACEAGQWPEAGAAPSAAVPIIGVSAYQLAKEHAAEVEAAS
jgi:methylmalonyl-CoA mutase